MSYTYPIQKANDVQVRTQIMEHLETLHTRDLWPAVKTVIEADETCTIEEDFQLIMFGPLDLQGSLVLEGQLILLSDMTVAVWG